MLPTSRAQQSERLGREWLLAMEWRLIIGSLALGLVLLVALCVLLRVTG